MSRHHMSNGAILVIFGLLYAGLLILFGWQTYQFLNFLFPSDQLLMKTLTLISFDVLAFLWGATDLFYSFASRGAKAIVKWAWGLTFLLSLSASILYMIVQSMFRFHIEIDQNMVNVGFAIAIIAVTFNILCIMFFLYNEYNARNPHQDDFFSWQTQERITESLQPIKEEGTTQLANVGSAMPVETKGLSAPKKKLRARPDANTQMNELINSGNSTF